MKEKYPLESFLKMPEVEAKRAKIAALGLDLDPTSPRWREMRSKDTALADITEDFLSQNGPED